MKTKLLKRLRKNYELSVKDSSMYIGNRRDSKTVHDFFLANRKELITNLLENGDGNVPVKEYILRHNNTFLNRKEVILRAYVYGDNMLLFKSDTKFGERNVEDYGESSILDKSHFMKVALCHLYKLTDIKKIHEIDAIRISGLVKNKFSYKKTKKAETHRAFVKAFLEEGRLEKIGF